MMMICFVEDTYTLFVEACLRGWLAAILDFPHRMDRIACEAAAQSIPDDLRPEVCCITDEYAYRHLVVIAWCSYYISTEPCSEREMAVAKSVLASRPFDEALQFVRETAHNHEAQTVISDTYTQYCLSVPSH